MKTEDHAMHQYVHAFFDELSMKFGTVEGFSSFVIVGKKSNLIFGNQTNYQDS